MLRNQVTYLIFTILALLAAGLLSHLSDVDREPEAGVFNVLGFQPMSAADLERNASDILPTYLLILYQAFGLSSEAETYDALSLVAAGDALESLYLEHAGMHAGSGLEAVDQTIHQIELHSASIQNAQIPLILDASWQVIGTVKHAAHQHVRGNSYRALVTISPVDDAWKLTDFKVLDVNREAAGTILPAVPPL